MKKSLSLLVAIAMVFSMFATVVSAAEEQQQSAGEYLNELGVILGNGDDLKEDQTWKRQDVVVLLSRLFGAEEEAKDAEKTHAFKDVTDKNYDGYISWAVEEGLVLGKSATVFGFGDELENRDFYALVLRALGQDVEYADVDEVATEAGLAPDGTDFDAVPLRGATYTAIVGALKTEVEPGVTLEEKLGLVEMEAVTSTQTGAKQITVKFNKAVDDTKAKFAVKNGVATRDVVKTTFSEDKTSAILDLSSKLLNGESTVTVSGVSEADLVASFTAAEEKITEIQFLSDKAALGTLTTEPNKGQADYTKISVGYKIVNQFNEDVTKNAGGSLTFQVGKAGATGTGNNGILTITTPATSPFMFNEQVYVSAILNLSTYGVTATKTLTVGQQAMVDTVDILGLYHPDGKELMTNSTFSDFYILVDAKDQYGNKVTLEQFKAGVFAVTSNGTLFTVNKDNAQANVGENNDQIGIPLTAPTTGIIVFDGTNQVRVQTLFGQKIDTLDVVVKKASTLTTFTLAQPDVVSAGNTVKIPFTAQDQNGVELKKHSDLIGKVNLYASNGTIKLLQNYATKEAYIEWKAPAITGLNFISATVIGTNSSSQLQINVVEAGKADAVVGLKDVSKSLYVGSKVKIEPKHIVIKDQFGRDLDSSVVASTYDIKISAADGTANVVTGFTTAPLTSTGVELSAPVKGSERVKVELFKKGTSELISTYEGHTFTVIDNGAIESYEVATIEKISTEAGHGVEVKVTGKRTDGTTVTLPQGAYTVLPSAPLQYVDGKLSVEGGANAIGGADKTKVVNYTVQITANSSVIVKETTLTSEALRPTTLEQKDLKVDGTTLLKAADLVVKGSAENITLANVLATVKVKDQFGVEITQIGDNVLNGDDFYVSVSAPDDVNVDPDKKLTINGSGSLVNNASVTNVAQGDSFTATFVAKTGGANIIVKVVAE